MSGIVDRIKLNRDVVKITSDELGIPEEKIPVLIDRLIEHPKFQKELTGKVIRQPWFLDTFADSLAKDERVRQSIVEVMSKFYGRRSFLEGIMAGAAGAAVLGAGISRASAKTVISDNNVIIDDQWYLKAPMPFSAIVYIDGTKVIAKDWKGKEILSGTAGVDDASVIQGAIDAVKPVLDGELRIVDLSGQEYIISKTIVLPSQVILRNGKLKLANGANTDIIKTERFDTLTGQNKWFVDTDGLPYRFGLVNIFIDGNKANNTTGYGVKIYGKGYIIDNLIIVDCPEVGFYSEAGAVVGQHDWRDMPESHIYDLVVRNCDSNNILFRGPHDAVFYKVISAYSGGYDFKTEFLSNTYNGACNVEYIHTYGGNGIYLGAWGFKGNIVESENGVSIDGYGHVHINQLNCIGELLINQYYARITNAYLSGSGNYAIKIAGNFNYVNAKILSFTSNSDLVQIEGNNNRITLSGEALTLGTNACIRIGTSTASRVGNAIEATLNLVDGVMLVLYSAGRNKIVINGYLSGTATDWDDTTYPPHSRDFIRYFTNTKVVTQDPI